MTSTALAPVPPLHPLGTRARRTRSAPSLPLHVVDALIASAIARQRRDGPLRGARVELAVSAVSLAPADAGAARRALDLLVDVMPAPGVRAIPTDATLDPTVLALLAPLLDELKALGGGAVDVRLFVSALGCEARALGVVR